MAIEREISKPEEEKPKMVGIKIERVLPPQAIPTKVKRMEARETTKPEMRAREVAESFVKALEPTIKTLGSDFRDSEINKLLFK